MLTQMDLPPNLTEAQRDSIAELGIMFDLLIDYVPGDENSHKNSRKYLEDHLIFLAFEIADLKARSKS